MNEEKLREILNYLRGSTSGAVQVMDEELRLSEILEALLEPSK